MQRTQSPGTRPARALSGLLVGAGLLHILAPKYFDSIVPPALPGEARNYTYASGVAEIAVGTALLVPRTRRLGGTAAAALFVAVFPANIQMTVDWLRSSKTSRIQKAIVVARLPLQVPLILAALKARQRQVSNDQ